MGYGSPQKILPRDTACIEMSTGLAVVHAGLPSRCEVTKIF